MSFYLFQENCNMQIIMKGGIDLKINFQNQKNWQAVQGEIQHVKDDMQLAVIENYLMIRMPREVDHHRAADIREHADAMIFRENVRNIVFDFEDTTFMDSAGIGIIVGRYRKISCVNGRVFAINADQRIRKILAAPNLINIITVIERK